MPIALDRVSKTFPGGRVAVSDLSLEILDGELLVLVGPSGCGKSTVLRLIAGLETPTSGRILIDGRDMTDVPPNERDLAMVFQSYALYPHKTVAENLAFGLRMRGVDRASIDARVRAVAETLHIEPLLALKPAQLSGGQRQRVAVGRAIVREPRAFLLDEPLSNLDPQLRTETRAELGQLHRRLRTTMIYVTHDQEEAMTLGDRIAVMRQGSSEQTAPPLHVYERPANTFVATFVGSPKMNLLGVTTRAAATHLMLDGPGFSIEAPPLVLPSGLNVVLGVRPRDAVLVAPDDRDFPARVVLTEVLGHEAIVHVVLDDGHTRMSVATSADRPPQPSDVVHVRLRRDRLHVFAADTGRRLGS